MPPEAAAFILLEDVYDPAQKAMTIHIHPDSVTSLQLGTGERMQLALWVSAPLQNEDEKLRRDGTFALMRGDPARRTSPQVRLRGPGAAWWRKIISMDLLERALGQQNMVVLKQEFVKFERVCVVVEAIIESTPDGNLLVFDPSFGMTVAGYGRPRRAQVGTAVTGQHAANSETGASEEPESDEVPFEPAETTDDGGS